VLKLLMPATPVHRARLTVLGRIAAAGRPCWAYSRARMAEWQCRARSRRLTRIGAEIEASTPFWRE
jgi:hypothetical protein